jgi:hypothetical protein
MSRVHSRRAEICFLCTELACTVKPLPFVCAALLRRPAGLYWCHRHRADNLLAAAAYVGHPVPPDAHRCESPAPAAMHTTAWHCVHSL